MEETVAVATVDQSSAALVAQPEGGVFGLALMSEEQFRHRLDALKLGQERVRTIQRELMTGPTPENPEGEDYGVIPGTKKPTLLKAGSEKICKVYGLVPTFGEIWIEGDGVTTPHLRVRMKCLLHVGTADGPVVGEGVGAANSWERKHRYRGALKACPSCGCEGTIRRSSFEKNGDRGWYCHGKAGGCGDQFRSDDPRIIEQQAGQVQNPDPYDVENTLLKMAKKRSQVDATLTATATSGLFTQDVEEQQQDPPPPQTTARAEATAEREPGDDSDEGEAEAYARAGVEPPARRAATPQPRAAGKVPCPHCGTPAGPSKFPKAGKTHYCYGCKHPFDPANPEPGE